MARIRSIRIATVAIALLAGAVLVLGSTLSLRSQDNDRGVVASLLSRALSTPAARIGIGAVTGALSSDVVLQNVTISDRDGVWLELDRARMVWRRTALFFRRLEIDRLEVGNLTIRRPPVPSDEAVSNEPILPELPVKLDIKAFILTQLALGAPVLGIDARLAATGAISLGNPSEGLDLRLDARRLDAPGAFVVRFAYVPQTSRLDMTANLDEPANGLLANTLKVPGTPPVKLDLTGAGTLESFAAKLAFDAGPDIGANGQAQLGRNGAGRQLTLDLASRIEGLLPPLARPVFAGTTRLNGVVGFGDDGAVTIRPVTVESTTARLAVNGTLSPERVADLTIAVRSLPNAGDKTAADGAEIRSLVFDATMIGPIMGPRVNAVLALADARLPQGRVARLDARFDMTPSGSVTDAATAVPFSATAEASGVEASDPAVARAIGDRLSLVAEGTLRDGIADVTRSRIRTGTAEAAFTGRAGNAVLNGRATLDMPDLSRFGAAAGIALRGALTLGANLDGIPNTGRIAAVLDGRIRNFGTGLAAVDGLAGGTVTLAGTARRFPGNGFGFQDLRLNGAHVTSRFDGDVTRERAALDALVTIAELGRADARLSGRGEIKARISGTLDRPDAAATLAITNARALGRPVPRLNLDVQASDVTGLIDARTTLAGIVDGKEAKGAARLARRADGGWLVEGLDVAVGSVAARGNLTLDAANLAQGRLTIAARNLDDLSPLALTRLAGQLDADATLTVTNGGQGAAITAKGDGLRFGPAGIERLSARAAITDLYRRPVVDGDIGIDRAIVAGESFNRVRLVAKGAADASDVTLTAEARGFALDARGRVIPADVIRFELASFTARRGERRIALANPATLTLLDGGVDIRALTLALDQGRLSVNGRAGNSFDLTVAARDVPLSITDVAMVDLGLQGTLDGDARLTGAADNLSGTWKINVSRLSAPQTRSFGLPAIDVNANGRIAGRRVSVDATANAAAAGTLRLNGTVPLDGDGLDLGVRGRINLGVVNTQITAAGRRVAGNADVDLRVGGSLSRPRITGGVNLAGGSFNDAAYGVQLTNINGRIAARGEEIVIERLTAQARNGATLSVRGQVRVDPDAGFPGAIQISGREVELFSSDLVKMIASPALSISGPLTRDPRITGRIDIASMDVTVPERLPETSKPLPKTRYVSPPPQVAARLRAEAQARGRAGRTPPFNATLDLQISAPNRVFVRGRGIDAELGGSLRLSGRLSDPVTIGAFDLRRGRISILGQRLDFTRARLAFTGDLTPDLDLMAQTRAGDITAQITVSGRASEPSFAFSSSPDLPQDEVLSRILFQKASGGLSPFQALQLAQVAAQFSGGGGSDAFERIRRSLGVDTLDISTSRSGDPTVGVSRAISDRISVGVKAGSTGENSGVTVDIDVTRRVRVQGEAYGNGGTAVGVGAEWEY